MPKFKYGVPKSVLSAMGSGQLLGFAWAKPTKRVGVPERDAVIFGKVVLFPNSTFTIRGFRVPRVKWDKSKVFKGPVELLGSLHNYSLYLKTE